MSDDSFIHGVDCSCCSSVAEAKERGKGRKDDHGKDPWDLVPWGPLRAVVKVLAFGANRYGVDNWKVVPKSRTRYFAAALRHLLSWFQGQKLDSDSGLPHLAHCITCLLFLMWFDDEPKPVL